MRRMNISVYHHQLPLWHDPEQIFLSLFKNQQYSFWLDSNKISDERSRFSYMGIPTKRIHYNLTKHKLTIIENTKKKILTVSIFDYLEKELARQDHSESLPFDFIGGFIGYFGYALQSETIIKQDHTSPFPEAYFFFVDRFLVFDHREKCIYLVCLAEDKKTAEVWFNQTELRIRNYELRKNTNNISRKYDYHTNALHDKEKLFHFSPNKQQYLKNIKTCQEYLRSGDCYQICLTNQITAAISIDWLKLYRTLRKINTSPYGTYMRFGNFAVLSSSPEQFLTIDSKRTIFSKPMKGTVKRGETIEEDKKLAEQLGKTKKDYAENSMIVDLLRNDLGKVCQFGSIAVSKFLDVETYATVHQLVSTITGILRDTVTVIEAIKAAFPGGSMTGTPKLRAIEILAEIEKQPRGIYAGTLGFLSLNGTVSLSMIIRTIIATQKQVSFGTGGAILIDSDPQSEYEEMLLKSAALMNAIRKVI